MDIKKYLPEIPIISEEICSKKVSTVIIDESHISPDLSLPFGDFEFNVNAEAAYSLKLLNDSNDNEEEKNIIKNWKEINDLYKSGGMLVYSFTGRLKAQGSGNVLERFELGLDAEKDLEVKSFRFHKCDENVGDAILSDIIDFKIAFKKDDILGMGINDAFSVKSHGKLSMKAAVKVSDAVSGSVSVISDFLNLNGKLNVKLDVSASFDLKVEIEDDFEIMIIRKEEDNFLVAINKMINREFELGAKAGIVAGIEKDEDLDEITDQFIKGIDNKTLTPIIEAINDSGIQEKHSDLIEDAVELLGWDPEDISIDKFTEKIDKLKKDLKEKIKKTITSKVEIGISYEYRRIKSKETLFKAEFTEDGINDHFLKIIRLKTDELIELPERKRKYVLKNYFQRIIEEQVSSFGINFAFGNFKLSKATVNKFKQVTDFTIEDENKKLKISAYNRETTKTFVHGKNKDEYGMNFSADMSEFVKSRSELTCEKFDFEFGLSVEMLEKKTSKLEQLDIVDYAITWDIINPEEFDNLLETLKEIRRIGGRNIKYKMFLRIAEDESDNGKVETDLFDQFISAISNADNMTFASAMAAAVPYADYLNKPSFSARREIDQRRQYYTSFWLRYIDELHKTQSHDYQKFMVLVGETLYNYFDGIGYIELAEFENGKTSVYPKFGKSRLAEVLAHNNIGFDIKNLRDGFNILNSGINNQQKFNKVFKSFFKKVRNTDFHKEYNLRFIGRLLLDLADQMGVKEQINLGLEITYKEDGNDKTMVIG